MSMRDIRITPALNCYILKVGCQTIVFNDRGTMLTELGRYLEKPADVEREYIDNAVNSMGPADMTGAEQVPEGMQQRAEVGARAVTGAYTAGLAGSIRG